MPKICKHNQPPRFVFTMNNEDDYYINQNFRPTGVAPATPRMMNNSYMRNPSQETNTPPPAPVQSRTSQSRKIVPPAVPQAMSPNQERRRASAQHKGQFHRRSLGDWDFLETVGAGSMGKVKLAQNRNSREVCAIKIVARAAKTYMHNTAGLPPPMDEHEALKRQKQLQKEYQRDKRTIREASLGKLLFHPYICRLYEMVTMSNHFYMLFEYISGGQLLDYIIQHGSLKERHARKFARGIASALDYLHKNNIVHRDLKIENILISDNGEIKLIDFGLSNMFNMEDRLKTFCGSLYFAAPELLSAKPYTGPEVDFWSFGVVIYVLVCGKVPFDDENVSVLHEKIKKGHVEYPAHLSIEVISLLSKMLVVNPVTRGTLADIINHPWMKNGYDFPPNSYVPKRKPLELPLDRHVIQEMVKLDLIPSEEEGMYELNHIVSSREYATAPNPTEGFHPLVSLYHLTEEMLFRKYNHQQLHQQQSPQQTQFPQMQQALPALPQQQMRSQASQLLPPQRTQSTHVPATPKQQPESQQQLQSPAVVVNPASVATSSVVAEPELTPPQAAHTSAKHSAEPETSFAPSLAVHQQSSPSPEEKGISSLFRRLSSKKPSSSPQRYHSVKVPKTHGRTLSEHVPSKAAIATAAASSQSSAAPKLPVLKTEEAQERRYHPSARAKSVGHARAEQLNYKRPTPGEVEAPPLPNIRPPSPRKSGLHPSFEDVAVGTELSDAEIIARASQVPPGSMPSIDYPRSMFLKGFFSVQTTSSKPLPIVRYKIITVLRKLGIQYKEVRGGFVCVHNNIHEVAGGHKRKFSLGTAALTRGASIARRAPPSSGNGPIAGVSAVGTTSDESSSTASLESLSNQMEEISVSENDSGKKQSPVKFEIHIVKVPMVGLAGVHFKKVNGNAWMYKELATHILKELNL